MLIGAHILLYTSKPEADRAFFREVLGFQAVDVGGGWLIFKLPPAEAAVHPIDAASPARQEGPKMAPASLYLMCDDVKATVASLAARGITCGPVERESWGLRTAIPLPSGVEVGLYQPTHATAIALE
jgi:catechol 2,3-dioxygenase-like lactoylglutathione lyase family enzyme